MSERFLIALVMLLTSLGIGSSEQASLDWTEPFAINGVCLGDNPGAVLSRLGKPVRFRRQADGDLVWYFKNCEVLLSRDAVVGVRGTYLSQLQRVVHIHEFDTAGSPEILGGSKIYTGSYHPRPGLGIPSSLPAKIAVNGASASLPFSIYIPQRCDESLRILDPSLKPQSLDRISGPATQVVFVTTRGQVVIDIYRSGNPQAAERFLELVELGFYNNTPFYVVLPGYMVEFGVNWAPEFEHLRYEDLEDEEVPRRYRYEAGLLTLRSGTQVLVNTEDFEYAPNWGQAIGRISSGLEVFKALAPSGDPIYGFPDGLLWTQGEELLATASPKLDRIVKAYISGPNGSTGLSR